MNHFETTSFYLTTPLTHPTFHGSLSRILLSDKAEKMGKSCQTFLLDGMSLFSFASRVYIIGVVFNSH